jgi:Bacterial archaeo-eukaryotic release factor family 3
MSLLPRKDIEPLLRVSGGPCVSIFLPTFRAGGERVQNPIRLKNVVRGIAERLEEDWGMRSPDADKLLDPVKQLIDDNSFWLHQSDGLALFLSPDTFKSFRLPVQLNELAVVEKRFHLKPLLPLLSGDGDGHFYILTLSRKHIRLLSGSRFRIDEVDLEGQGVPTSFTEALGELERRYTQMQASTSSKTPHRFSMGQKGAPVFSAHGTGEDDLGAELRNYFERFDDALVKIDIDRKAPVVLAGVEYLLPIYRDAATTLQNICQDALTGNMDQVRPEDLHAAAWEIVEPHFLQERRKAAERFGDLTGSGRSSTELNEVLPAAHDGRVDSLFVARGVRVWGSYDGDKRKIEFQLGQDGPRNGNEDLLDLAAVQTYLNGGKVFVVDQQDVPEGKSLAAVFRY